VGKADEKRWQLSTNNLEAMKLMRPRDGVQGLWTNMAKLAGRADEMVERFWDEEGWVVWMGEIRERRERWEGGGD
jgi:hypothetical protein